MKCSALLSAATHPSVHNVPTQRHQKINSNSHPAFLSSNEPFVFTNWTLEEAANVRAGSCFRYLDDRVSPWGTLMVLRLAHWQSDVTASVLIK